MLLCMLLCLYVSEHLLESAIENTGASEKLSTVWKSDNKLLPAELKEKQQRNVGLKHFKNKT